MNELFFEIIRVAIGTQENLSRIPSNTEWKLLYQMAKKQSLVGICFVALQRLGADSDEGYKRINMSEMLYLTWMGMAAKIQQKNEIANSQCREVQVKFSSDGYRSCILKGQSIAQLYDSHLINLRQSGDIDIWVEGNRKNIINYVESISSVENVRLLHINTGFFEDTEVEVHFRPSYLKSPMANRKLQSFFNSEANGCFSIGHGTIRFNQVFIISHIFRHLTSEGIGLRQIMDYYFVLKYSLERNNLMPNKDFHDLMCSFGMLNFAKGIMWVMNYIFGLSKDCFLCESSEKYGRFLLDEIMQSGNFGKEDVRNNWHEGNIISRFIKKNLFGLRLYKLAPREVLIGPIWRVYHWLMFKTKD